MENIPIGEQISKLRKAAGLTQEELGKAAGVSTQAVSRWECGGMPDVALLPAIADKLGVTIDALFGREPGVPQDMEHLLVQWLQAWPESQRMQKLAWLLWQASFSYFSSSIKLPVDYPQSCDVPPEFCDGSNLLERTLRLNDGGMILGIGSEELSFLTVFPEPQRGYAAYLASGEEYRRLFSALALPGAVELLVFLYSKKDGYYTVPLLSKQLAMPAEQAQALLEALCQAELLQRIDVALDDHTVFAYKGQADCGLVPFLYFARWMAQSKHIVYYTGGITRKAALFRTPKAVPEEKNHETT